MIPAALVPFLEEGVSIQVGSRDGRLTPECLRGVGARVDPAAAEVTVFLPAALAARTLANLADNGRIAVCLSRPADHRSLQLKGQVSGVEPAAASDRASIDGYLRALARQLDWLGIPAALVLRMNHWPAVAVRFRVESVYEQTPGPGAGEPLDQSADGATR